tara:strand:+ start:45 stop:281 length:237 start_codon:yes stop_codon:yes gene_type:complete
MRKSSINEGLNENLDLSNNIQTNKCNLNCICKYKLCILLPMSVLVGSFVTLYLQHLYCNNSDTFLCKNINENDGSNFI